MATGGEKGWDFSDAPSIDPAGSPQPAKLPSRMQLESACFADYRRRLWARARLALRAPTGCSNRMTFSSLPGTVARLRREGVGCTDDGASVRMGLNPSCAAYVRIGSCRRVTIVVSSIGSRPLMEKVTKPDSAVVRSYGFCARIRFPPATGLMILKC